MAYVYILTNHKQGVLYVGVARVLDERLTQHLTTQEHTFVKKYRLNRLVHGEEFSTITEAILREKQLKNWHRDWKINLIEQSNPDWHDLMRDPETSSG